MRGWGGVNRRGIRFFVGCALIIHLIIQTILLYLSGAVWTDDAAHVSRLDPSGAVQVDAEHPTRNWKIGGSNPSSSSTRQSEGVTGTAERGGKLGDWSSWVLPMGASVLRDGLAEQVHLVQVGHRRVEDELVHARLLEGRGRLLDRRRRAGGA